MNNMCVWWWSVVLLLINIKSTSGFVQPTSFIIDNSYQKERSTTLSSSDNNNDEYSDMDFNTLEYNNADSITRRRLMLSLLSSATFGPLAANAITNTNPTQSSSTLVTANTSNIPVTIIKPPLDKRAYSTYTLPNGLKVLLCSDPASVQSAVAMNVHVGACSDPVEIPGLAHFCEHMLFLGTKLYPEEGDFSKFLSSNGKMIGVYVADVLYTYLTLTCYLSYMMIY